MVAEEGKGGQQAEVVDNIAESSRSEMANEVDVLVHAMLKDDLWTEGAQLPRDVREVAAAALEYERREAKPMWWRRFEWLDSTQDELMFQPDVLAGLQRTDSEPYKRSPRKRRLVHEYSFDPRQVMNRNSSTLLARFQWFLRARA